LTGLPAAIPEPARCYNPSMRDAEDIADILDALQRQPVPRDLLGVAEEIRWCQGRYLEEIEDRIVDLETRKERQSDFDILIEALRWCMGEPSDPIERLPQRIRLEQLGARVLKNDHNAFCVCIEAALTDEILQNVVTLRKVPNLVLNIWPPVSDNLLYHLGGLKNLTQFWLFNCLSLTDRGLGHLASLTAMETLYLDLCERITDSGLRKLRDLNNLRWLAFRNQRITSHGIRELQQALPNCRVSRITTPLPAPPRVLHELDLPDAE